MSAVGTGETSLNCQSRDQNECKKQTFAVKVASGSHRAKTELIDCHRGKLNVQGKLNS